MTDAHITEEELLATITGRHEQMGIYETWADPAACVLVVALAVLLSAIVVILVHNRVRRTGDPGGKDLTVIVACFCALGVIAVAYMVWSMHCSYVDAEAALREAEAFYLELYGRPGTPDLRRVTADKPLPNPLPPSFSLYHYIPLPSSYM